VDRTGYGSETVRRGARHDPRSAARGSQVTMAAEGEATMAKVMVMALAMARQDDGEGEGEGESDGEGRS
jgi:hypothetical protein